MIVRVLMVLLAIVGGPAYADLPAYALQILCKGDKAACRIVISETVSALVVGVTHGARGAADVMVASLEDSPGPVDNGTISAIHDVLSEDGYNRAFDLSGTNCRGNILTDDIVSRVLNEDPAELRAYKMSAAEYVLAQIRGIYRARCKHLQG